MLLVMSDSPGCSPVFNVTFAPRTELNQLTGSAQFTIHQRKSKGLNLDMLKKKLDRRRFLKASGAGLTGLTLLPNLSFIAGSCSNASVHRSGVFIL